MNRKLFIGVLSFLLATSPVFANDGLVVPSVASGSGTVTTTGSPATGNLAKFSGATSVVNGDLSGDCTTSGALAITCTKTGGSAFGALATATPGSGVSTLLAGTASGSGGPVGTTNPTLGLTQVFSASNNLTAHAGGGGVGSCLVLTSVINNFGTVATNGDSTCLPAATAGEVVFVGNAISGRYLTIFPASGEQINSAAANASVNLSGMTGVVFVSSATGRWQSYLPVVGTANDIIKLDANGFMVDGGFVLSGTAGQTYTLNATGGTLAELALAQVWTASTQTFSSGSINFSGAGKLQANTLTLGSGTNLTTCGVPTGAGGSPVCTVTKSQGSFGEKLTFSGGTGSFTGVTSTLTFPNAASTDGYYCEGTGGSGPTVISYRILGAPTSTTSTTLNYYTLAGTTTFPGLTDVLVIRCQAE